MTLKDDSGLVKQYAMVNVKNYGTVGVGTSLKEALNEYKKALSKSGASVSSGEQVSEKTVTGKVIRIGLVITDEMTYYDMVLENDPNTYSVSTDVSRQVALTVAGDQVEITYLSGNQAEEGTISATGFSNQTLEQSGQTN